MYLIEATVRMLCFFTHATDHPKIRSLPAWNFRGEHPSTFGLCLPHFSPAKYNFGPDSSCCQIFCVKFEPGKQKVGRYVWKRYEMLNYGCDGHILTDPPCLVAKLPGICPFFDPFSSQYQAKWKCTLIPKRYLQFLLTIFFTFINFYKETYKLFNLQALKRAIH